jgi:alanine racemase
VRVTALLGPLERAEFTALAEHGITALAMHLDMLEKLAEAASAERPVEVCLKFDTGMGRLGFTKAQVPGLVAFLKDHPEVRPVAACSHLATADDPNQGGFVHEQAELFRTFVDFLATEGFDVQAHLANSAAILAHGGTHHHAQRGGIALYGANPFHGTAWERRGSGLLPAMEVSAPVLQVHDLPRGRSISYGRTYTAERDMRVAIVGAGYADNYSRHLSNTGQMHYQGHRLPIVGRVCMQMTAVDLTPLASTDVAEPRPGDRVELLGGHGLGEIRPEDLAQWWGTIPYEVFCLLGMNRRTYVEDEDA